jgi:hypothetical protein
MNDTEWRKLLEVPTDKLLDAQTTGLAGPAAHLWE